MLNNSDNYDSFVNNAYTIDDKNDNISINLKLLLLPLPGGVLLISLIGITIWTMIEPLLPNKNCQVMINYGEVSFRTTSLQKVEYKI